MQKNTNKHCNTCPPEDTHREFNKTNRHELFLKSSLSAKGRRSTDPITNFRAKVRTSPRKPETPLGLHSWRVFQPLPLSQHEAVLFSIGQTKENRIPDIYSNYDYYNYLHKEIYGY